MQKLLVSKIGHWVVMFMIALTLGLALSPRAAMAGFVSNLDSSVTQTDDLNKIRSLLENKKISTQLSILGYSQVEVEERLAQLSPDEIHNLAGQLDQSVIPAGDGTVGIVIGVVVVLLVVLGVMSLMGKRVVVTE